MILTDEALERISNKRTRTKLALALDLSDQQIIKYIKANSDNLTKAAALKVIREDTGMTDAEILAEETKPSNA